VMPKCVQSIYRTHYTRSDNIKIITRTVSYGILEYEALQLLLAYNFRLNKEKTE